jgi:hypothetical protein
MRFDFLNDAPSAIRHTSSRVGRNAANRKISSVIFALFAVKLSKINLLFQ